MITTILAVIATPVGRWLALGALGLGLYGAGMARGYNWAAGTCEAAALRTGLAAARRDLAVTQAAQEDAQRQADALAKQDAANADRIRDYKAALAKNPNPACPLGAADVRRLRDIR